MIYKSYDIEDENISFRHRIILTSGIEGAQIIIDDTPTNYIITEEGLVYNIKTEYELKRSMNNKGYYVINIQLGGYGKYKTKLVHRLLGLAYIPNPNNYPIINHKDGIKINISLDNLEWCSYAYNSRHAFDNNLVNPHKHDLFEKCSCSLRKHKLYEVEFVCSLLEKGYTPKAIQNIFGISAPFASKIYRRQSWTDISKQYNFVNVLHYSQFFNFKDVKRLEELFELGFTPGEAIKYLNWEYSELLRSRVKQVKRIWKRYRNVKTF